MLSYILATEPVENVTDTSIDVETMPMEGKGRYNETIYGRRTPDNVIYYNSENHINYGKFVYLLHTHACTNRYVRMYVYIHSYICIILVKMPATAIQKIQHEVVIEGLWHEAQ